jgi:hypothetical protein
MANRSTNCTASVKRTMQNFASGQPLRVPTRITAAGAAEILAKSLARITARIAARITARITASFRTRIPARLPTRLLRAISCVVITIFTQNMPRLSGPGRYRAAEKPSEIDALHVPPIRVVRTRIVRSPASALVPLNTAARATCRSKLPAPQPSRLADFASHVPPSISSQERGATT